MPGCLGPSLREIVLIDIELDLQIVQIGHGNDVALGAFVADEAGGDELALFDVALENGAVDGRADDGVVELHLRVVERALGLLTCARSASISSWRGPRRTSS